MGGIETRQVSWSHLPGKRCRDRRGIGLEMHGGTELINVTPQSSENSIERTSRCRLVVLSY